MGRVIKENQVRRTSFQDQRNDNSEFIQRIGTIPFIKSVITNTQYIAESTLIGRFVSSAVQCMIPKELSSTSDKLGCKLLDMIEDRLPIVKDLTYKMTDIIVYPLNAIKLKLQNVVNRES